MSCGVYAIQNTVNGKVYVGSSKNIEVRWRNHRHQLNANRHHSRYLQRVWNLDGADAFIFKILIICSKENLILYERIGLSAWKHANYNVSQVCGTRLGVPQSEETRKKIGEAVRNMSDETRRKMGQAHVGLRHSEESKLKMSEIGKARVIPEETRQRMSESSKARVRAPLSEETKLKISIANKAYAAKKAAEKELT